MTQYTTTDSIPACPLHGTFYMEKTGISVVYRDYVARMLGNFPIYKCKLCGRQYYMEVLKIG